MRWPKIAVAAALCLVLVGCGGGGGGTSSYTGGGSTGGSQTPSVLSITNPTLPYGIVQQSYSAQLQASGGTAPYKWSAGTNFPSWLTLDTNTGSLTGTVPQQSSYDVYNVPVTVTDSAATPAKASKMLYINTSPPITISSMPPTATRGVAYSWRSSLTFGYSPYTITVDSGMPAGLQLAPDSGGSPWFNLQGTPTEAGQFTIKVHVHDGAQPAQDIVIPLNLTVDTKLTITSIDLGQGMVGRPFNGTLTAANGTLPLTWAVSNLPAGLTLNAATGAISGTPTAVTGSISITVTDSSTPPVSATGYASLRVYSALQFSMPATIQLHVRSGEFEQFFAGGIPPVASTVTSGSLPPGVIIDYQNFLSGTPTQTGTYTATVHLQDSGSPPDVLDQAFTFNVLPPLPLLSDLPLPAGAIGKAYSAQLWAREGSIPYHWSVAGGQLPPGLTLNDDGTITGTPTTLPGYNQTGFTFTAAVTDSASPPQTANHYYSIAITSAPKGRNDTIANATPASYPGLDATLSPFADPPDATTGNPDTDYYRLSAKAGTIVNVSVGSNNTVDPVIEIVDANGQRYRTCNDPGDDNPTLSFIAKDATPNAYDDECLNDDIDPTVNRSAALAFQVPGAAGTQIPFYVHVFDSSGYARPDMQYRLSLSSEALPPLTAGATPFTVGSIGVAYNVQLWGGGGLGPWTWQVDSGALPPGLGLSQDSNHYWYVSGTPTTKGSYSFTLRITDSETPPQTRTAAYNIDVYDPLLITVDKFPDLKAGQPYSFVIPVSGGVPPYSWSQYGTGLWCCISVNQATGEWTGTYTGTTTQTFTDKFGVMDATGRSTAKTLTLTVTP